MSGAHRAFRGFSKACNAFWFRVYRVSCLGLRLCRVYELFWGFIEFVRFVGFIGLLAVIASIESKGFTGGLGLRA